MEKEFIVPIYKASMIKKKKNKQTPWGIVAKVLDCYIHFRTNTLEKGMNPLILFARGSIVLLLFLDKDGFDTK